MRNLKKILALVLALVMSLSLMATAGATDTTAAGNPNYQTSATVLQKLGVVVGDAGTGDIRPTDSITRAEVAALLYRIATGDVTDTQANIHTGQPFTDVNPNDWYTGYISYCYIAEIIKGNPNGSFEPNKEINGYATLAMILRAMGYGQKGEFVGDGWEIRTASIAKQIGILEGITDTQLSGSARREMVFEILFRAILKDTVRYNALHEDYDATGENLAKTKLGLEEITGVVVANEIADLGNSSPLAAGRTDLLVGEKTYKLKDFSTTAEEIGTSIHAYVKNNEVLAHNDAGSDIKDNEGAATSVKNLRGELSITDATEYYVNFDPVLKDTSDWRIEYIAPVELVKALGLSNTELTDNGCTLKTDGWNKVIRVGAKITAIDMAIIQEIFEYDDAEVDGKVYAGTETDTDRSDTMTWKKFRAEFLNLDENDAITSSDNGEWLRVIDNNNDGVAEYVLRTDFVMTTVTDYEKRTDVYEVEWKGGLPNGNGKGTIPASAIIKASEDTDLSVGSVILYTLIDGNYYVSNPDVVTLTVDKKSVNAKAGTFTADGETYTWSGIDEKAVKYYDTVSQLAYETKYDMYPDHFGYIRLATETTRNFVLLTDGYYSTDNRNSVMKADLYDGENAVYDADVADHARDDANFNGDGFIDTWENDHSGNASTWLRLNTFGEFYAILNDDAGTPTTNYWLHYADKNANTYTNGVYTSGRYTYYADPFYTNIALGSENDGTWTLEDVTNLDVDYNGLYRDYNTYELKSGFKFPDTDLWGITSWDSCDDLSHAKGDTAVADQAIQTNGRTLYYYVENPGAHGEDLKVQSWVGYKNVPEALEKAVALRAYAVTHEVYLANNELEQYEIADVVVIEGVPGSNAKNPQFILTGINSKREDALGKDGEGVYTEHDTEFGLFTANQLRSVITTDTDGLYIPQLNFYDGSYKITGSYAPITSNFADYGIYAGYVTVLEETKHSDYIEITADGKITSTRLAKFYTDEVPVYEIDQDTSRNWHGADNVNARENENIKRNDMLIVMLDGDGNTKLVINVSGSGKDGETYRNADGTYSEKNCIDKLYALFAAILDDQDHGEANWTYSEWLAEAWRIYNDPNASSELLDYGRWIVNAIAADIVAGEFDPSEWTVAEYAKFLEMIGSGDGSDGFDKKVADAVKAEVDAELKAELDEIAATVIEAIKAGVADANLSDIQKQKIKNVNDDLAAAKAAIDAVTVSDPTADYDNMYNDYVDDAVDAVEDYVDDMLNQVGVSEVEPGEMVPAGQPEGVTVEKRPEEDEEYTDYENVASEWEVTIPDTNTETEISFELYVPAGQTPYAPEGQTNVTSVTLTKRAAAAAQALSETVPADIYDVVITLTNAETATVVEILLLEEGDEPVPPELAVPVTVEPARLWDVTTPSDDGSATGLYTSYSVKATADATAENTWNVTVRARGVQLHKAGDGTTAGWVGVAFLPGEVNLGGTIVDAELAVKQSDGTFKVDTDCTFDNALYEVEGKEAEEAALIAEYFNCGTAAGSYSGVKTVKVTWEVDVNGTTEYVEHIFVITFDVTVVAAP